MKLWPLWLGISLAGVFALLYYGGWANAAATLVIALMLAPILYVRKLYQGQVDADFLAKPGR